MACSAVFFTACALIEEPSVEGERLEIIVPRDSLRTELATQLFYWYELEGAVEYELQLVSPSFNRIDRFLLDTLISGDKFALTLSPGTYQWRIRALNFSSATPFTYHTLFIDSTSDLSGQQLILQGPANRDTSALLNQVFSWLPLYNAVDYEVELWQPAVGGVKVFNQRTTAPTLTYPLTSEGAFEWRVRALNAESASAYESRTFFIDTAAPAAPLLAEPANNSEVSGDTVYFSWSRDQGGGSSLSDTLYLATDSSFTQGETMYFSRETSLNLTEVPVNRYYWRVKTRDKAGNSSPFSKTATFSKQ